MAMTFPSNPTTGQQYSVSGGPTYTWDGTVWKILTPGSQFSEQQFAATAGQTSFTVSGGYVIGAVDVYRNGVKLVVGVDFLATDLSTVTLVNAASAGDTIEVVKAAQILYADALKATNNLSDVGNAATARANIGAQAALGFTPLNKAGDTITGNLQLSGDYTAIGFSSAAGPGDCYLDVIPNTRTVRIRNWNTSAPNIQTNAFQAGTFLPAVGVQFPATQNASSDANTLDDYEEGTWTPYVNGSVALATSRYVKIGQVVFCEIVNYAANISSISATVGLYISGLPFTFNTYQYCMPCGQVAGVNFGIFDATGTTAPIGISNNASDYIQVTRNSIIGGGGVMSFRFSFTYRTTS